MTDSSYISARKYFAKEANKAAKELNFEKAAKLRDTIIGIEKVKSKQKVVSSTYKEQDVFALSVMDGKACFAVLRFEDNRLFDTEHFFAEEGDKISHLSQNRAALHHHYQFPQMRKQSARFDKNILCPPAYHLGRFLESFAMSDNIAIRQFPLRLTANPEK